MEQIDLSQMSDSALLDAGLVSRNLPEQIRGELFRRMTERGTESVSSSRGLAKLKRQAPHTILSDSWISLSERKTDGNV